MFGSMGHVTLQAEVERAGSELMLPGGGGVSPRGRVTGRPSLVRATSSFKLDIFPTGAPPDVSIGASVKRLMLTRHKGRSQSEQRLLKTHQNPSFVF